MQGALWTPTKRRLVRPSDREVAQCAGHFGFGLGVGGRQKRVSSGSLDPASLVLTAYYDSVVSPYTGSPWNGIASAGTSGSRTLAAGDAPVATSGAPDFDGSADYLVEGASLKYDSYVTRTAYFGQIVFVADTLAGAPAQPYNDELLLGENGGNLYVGVNSSGIQFGHYDDVAFRSTRTAGYIAISTGTKYVAQFWYDGSNLNLRTNTDTVGVSSAAASLTSAYNLVIPRIGQNLGAPSPAFFDGRIHQLILIASVPDSSTRTSLLNSAISTHGI